jgi:hypothetical protein
MNPAMADRGGRVVRDRGKLAAAVGVALAGLVLTVAGCSQALPLGPAPAPAPVPSHLASAIIMQPGLSDPGVSVRKCPVGSVALSGPGAVNGAPSGTSPVSSPSTPTGVCFRTLGKSVTFTSAGVAVVEQPAASQPVQHPASWVVRINLPAAEAAALAAVTTKLAGTQDQLAIIIAGQTWAMPVTLEPLTGGEFAFGAESKSQALQVQRLLQQPGSPRGSR